MQTILEKIPGSFPLPIVLIQHREREADDTLQFLLEHAGNLRVVEPENYAELRRGTLYLAPPDYHLLFEDNFIVLSVDSLVNYTRPSIDVAMESAADSFGNRAIGVILTGANKDGAEGLKAIQLSGGHTIVQNPETAERREMPDAAIAICKTDKILPLDEIGDYLVSIAN